MKKLAGTIMLLLIIICCNTSSENCVLNHSKAKDWEQELMRSDTSLIIGKTKSYRRILYNSSGSYQDSIITTLYTIKFNRKKHTDSIGLSEECYQNPCNAKTKLNSDFLYYTSGLSKYEYNNGPYWGILQNTFYYSPVHYNKKDDSFSRDVLNKLIRAILGNKKDEHSVFFRKSNQKPSWE